MSTTILMTSAVAGTAVPGPARVYHYFRRERFPADVGEDAVVGEQHDDVRGGQAVVEIDELGSAVVGNIGRQRGDEWLDYQDLCFQAGAGGA